MWGSEWADVGMGDVYERRVVFLFEKIKKKSNTLHVFK